MRDNRSAPLPRRFVLFAFSDTVPAEHYSALAVRSAFRRVKRVSVERVYLRGYPGSVNAFAHTVCSQNFVGEFAERQIPPLAHFEKVGALVRKVRVRRIERLFVERPFVQIVGVRDQRNPLCIDGVIVFQSARDKHAVALFLFVEVDERVAKIVNFKPLGRGETEIFILDPMQGVLARRAQNFLLGQSLLSQMRIVPRVVNDVLAVHLDTASREYI